MDGCGFLHFGLATVYFRMENVHLTALCGEIDAIFAANHANEGQKWKLSRNSGFRGYIEKISIYSMFEES